MSKTVIFLVAIQGIFGGVIHDDYIERLVFNTDSVELEATELNEDNENYNFTYSKGMWTCGICDVIDDTKLIYSDVLDVDSNVVDGPAFNVGFQMALALDDMQCVSVKAAADDMVRRISGSCLGPAITIDVSKARRVKVQVYGK